MNQQKEEAMFVCSLCCDYYDSQDELKLPKTLPCSHSFCSKCITAWHNLSQEKGQQTICPICKMVVAHDTDNIATNTSTLMLIEENRKSSLHCQSCINERRVEKCSICLKKLCNGCFRSHAQTCKTSKLTMIQNVLNANMEKLDRLQPTMLQNSECIRMAELEIERKYDFYLDLLNNEKRNIMNSLGRVKNTNEKYSNLQKSMNQTLLDLKLLQSTNQFALNNICEEFGKCGMNYYEFINSDIKLLEGINQKPNSYFGELITKELHLGDENEILDTSKPILTHVQGESILNKFCACSNNEPHVEIAINEKPSHMTSYGNLVFVCDDYNTLSIFEVCNSTIEVKKANQKLSITNIRDISVNSKYLATLYSDLTKEETKKFRKNMHSSGIGLFSRSEHLVSSNLHDCVYNKHKFEYPSSLVLTEDYLYVCGKMLGKIYKLDFSGNVLQKLHVADKIYDLSLNSKFLVYTDYGTHELNLVDLTSMKQVKKTKIHQENEYEDGPLNVELVDDKMMFVLNEARKEVYLYDINLSFITKFNVNACNVSEMAVVSSHSANALVLGCRTKSNSFKLSCFLPDTW